MTGYRDELHRAVSFTGTSPEFFARAKAGELVRLAWRHLGDPATLDALDAGCGIGLTDAPLRGRFRSLTGTDVSKTALETAAAKNPGVRYELAERDRLPFDDNTFDLVFAISVIQVVPPGERPRFVSELARVTRAAGLAVVFEHNPHNLLTRLVVRRFRSAEPILVLSMQEAKRLLGEHGLLPVDAAYFLLVPWDLTPLRRLEHALRRLPLGAQYYVAARPA